MKQPPQWTGLDGSVLEVWAAEVGAAATRPELAHRLSAGADELLPKFTDCYRRLCKLPRRTRREIARRVNVSLGGGQALAATIIVDGAVCTIVDAIVAANTDAGVGGCPRSGPPGAVTIRLSPGTTHTLFGAFAGTTGLPTVTSTITIDGRGSTIERDPGAPDFRLLVIDDSGDLTLEDVTLRGGSAPGTFPRNSGAGILNDGTLTISNSTITGNSGEGFGGGVWNTSGATLTVVDSTISGNSGGIGGGI